MRFPILPATMLAAAMMVFSAATASAEIVEFQKPKFKGHLLDWCVQWGQGCGKPAADAYCKTKGFEGAEAFNKWEDAGQATRLIGSNQVCDEEMCDSFTMIACSKPDSGEPEDATFKKPKFKGKRLDWCREWSTNCGKPAADAFCENKGYSKATDFSIAEDIGNTRIISTGETCEEPFCDGFKSITCQ